MADNLETAFQGLVSTSSKMIQIKYIFFLIKMLWNYVRFVVLAQLLAYNTTCCVSSECPVAHFRKVIQ